MCGIAGLIGKREGTDNAVSIVQSMMHAMHHRGPDDSGLQSWTLGSNAVHFGHTRLSIIDLSDAGHQPMTEKSGRYWTVFNGEIYNYKELQKILDPSHQLFRTSSDTEAILHAYHRWSKDSFNEFRGMFAFALLDTHARSVQLVRDPLGIKPLYYCEAAGRLLFASEVGALLASGLIDRRIHPDSIAHFMNYGWIGSTETSIAGIRMLPPGNVISVDLTNEKISWAISKYASQDQVHQPATDRDASSSHMLHLLEESVKSHLVSDVPVALFLSGGIDSTVLLQLMRRMGVDSPKTFTIVFQEEAFSERKYAKQVAELFDAEHHEIEIDESSILAQLPKAMEVMDQPTMDGVNSFVITKAVRDAGVKVAISGLGSDELFAGYPSFRRVRLAGMTAKAPASIRSGLASAGMRFGTNPSHEKFWDLLSSDGSPQSVYEISRRLFSNREMKGILPQTSSHRKTAKSLTSLDPINEISKLEFQGYMTNQLLRDTDFMSMANSLEVRVPFVDKKVVQYAAQIPGEWKLHGKQSKPFLLETMRGTVPEFVWNRTKMGFVLPFDRWMRSTLREQIQETLCSKSMAERVGMQSKGVEEVWTRFLAGEVKWSKPWSLFVLLKWCERHRASI